MLVTLGYFLLMVAFGMAFLQIIIPTIGLYQKNNFCMSVAKLAAIFQFIFIAIAFFILLFLFYSNNFSVLYVADNSNSHMPTLYRLCAVWGAHAGSLLLWIFMLSVWSAAFAFFSKHIPRDIQSRVLIVLGIISVFFYWFLFAYANPFLQVFPAPIQGGDLNPILQDPGLALHPPLLYLGYVGFSVVFALAIASLWRGEFNSKYAHWMRPWAKIAWCFLTLGIILGSWWSYRELGWGGFWFWDPVENASFMPWLAGTALIHVLIVAEKRNLFSAWTILLSISVFSLSILGTFLVRSGVLISIHTFSLDPNRGLFLLRLFAFVVGVSLFLYAWRARQFTHTEKIKLRSRETLILINTILLSIAMLIVLLGTLYPLIVDALGLGKISVGAPYFNIVLFPILMLVLFFMLFTVKIKNIGMIIAHIGVFVTVIGIMGSAVFSQEKQLSLKIGDHVNLSGYQFNLKNITTVKGANYQAFQALVWVEKNNKRVATLHPQLRVFTTDHIILPKAGIQAGIFHDFYVALGMPLPQNRWTMQIDVKPFIRWIWGGGLLMVVGALVMV